ncbi:OB-fold nucleic acid binding domain-containing protein, partial [Parasphingorhabdus sp.]
MHAFRSHNCSQLRTANVGEEVRLSGWIHNVRDHGNLMFVDLRDHFGLTQIVSEEGSEAFKMLDAARKESVITVTGKVAARSDETVNPNLPTGEVELVAEAVEMQGPAEELPMPVFGEQEYPEDIRLRYRFLDLRREKVHANMMLRSQVITSLRN